MIIPLFVDINIECRTVNPTLTGLGWRRGLSICNALLHNDISEMR